MQPLRVLVVEDDAVDRLAIRRALGDGSWKAAAGCGLCAAVAAYSAYYYVVYLALFAVAYTLAWWNVFRVEVEPRANSARAEGSSGKSAVKPWCSTE